MAEALQARDISPLPKILEPLTTELSNSFDSHPNNSKHLSQILLYGLTENLEGQPLLKPGALAHTLRALQLDGKIPGDNDSLKTYLSKTHLGIVDVGNLKAINEDPKFGSHQAGNTAILLHLESIHNASQKLGLTTLIFRAQGDEFLCLILPNLDADFDGKKFREEVSNSTNMLINTIKAEINHPLNGIAKNQSELITKTLDLIPLKDSTIPEETKRMSDIAELLMAEAEEADPSPTAKKINPVKAFFKKTIKKHLGDRKISQSSKPRTASTIDRIVQAVAETTKISKRESSKEELAKRWQIVDSYCPPSMKMAVEHFASSTKESPDQQALILTYIEEALFDTHLKRNPPILNPWAFLELTNTQKNNDGTALYKPGGMVSPYFLKLINSVDGRLGGNSVISGLADVISNSQRQLASTPQVIISKIGGSFYYMATETGASSFLDKLSEFQQAQIEKIIELPQELPYSLENLAILIREWSKIPVYSEVEFNDSGERTNKTTGLFLDLVRSKHYYSETALADQINLLCRLSPFTSMLIDLFYAERFLNRSSDYFKLSRLV